MNLFLRPLCVATCLIAGSASLVHAQSSIGGSWGTPVKPAAPAASPAPAVAPAPASAPVAPLSLDAAEKGYSDAWDAAPLTARHVTFILSDPAPVFGNYTARPNNVFKAGEKMVTYAEPTGFSYKVNGDNIEFGMAVDFVVKAADGKILGGQENFSTIAKTSRVRNRELMITLSLTVDGIEPGNYIVEYKLRDIAGPKTAAIVQPFVIAN